MILFLNMRMSLLLVFVFQIEYGDGADLLNKSEGQFCPLRYGRVC